MNSDTDLNAAALVAARMLATGMSVSGAAAAAGIDRVTLWRWRRTNPYFRAEVNRLRHEIHEATVARAQCLALKVVAAVDAGLETLPADERVNLAMRLLPLLGLRQLTAAPAGGTDVVEVINDIVRDDRRSRGHAVAGPVHDSERSAVLRWAKQEEAEARRKQQKQLAPAAGPPASDSGDARSGAD